MKNFTPALLFMLLLLSSSCAFFPGWLSSGLDTGGTTNLTGVFMGGPGASDTNAGTSPRAPVFSITNAFQIMKASGHTNLYIAGGVYTRTNGLMGPDPMFDSCLYIEYKTNWHISGGWDFSFTRQEGFSTLDGQNQVNNVLIITMSRGISLENLVIRGGLVSNTFGNHMFGAGLLVGVSSGCHFTNIMVVENFSSNNGGGIAFSNSYDCIFNGVVASNTASFNGGGILDNNGSNNTFRGLIAYNTAQYNGGGVHLDWGSYGAVVEADIIGNRCTNTNSGYGGGMTITGKYAQVRGRFIRNYSHSKGVLYINGSFNAVTADFISNGTYSAPSALMLEYAFSNYITNCLFFENKTTNSPFILSTVLLNSAGNAYIYDCVWNLNYSIGPEACVAFENVNSLSNILLYRNRFAVKPSLGVAIYQNEAPPPFNLRIDNNTFITNRLQYSFNNQGGGIVSGLTTNNTGAFSCAGNIYIAE